MCFCVQVIIGEICGGLSLVTSVSRGENPLVVEILLQYLSPFWASPNFRLHAWLWKIILLEISAAKEQAWSLTKLRSENSCAAHTSRLNQLLSSFFQIPALCTGALKHNQSNCRRLRKLVAKPNGFGCQKSGSIWAQRIVDTVGLFATKTKYR